MCRQEPALRWRHALEDRPATPRLPLGHPPGYTPAPRYAEHLNPARVGYFEERGYCYPVERAPDIEMMSVDPPAAYYTRPYVDRMSMMNCPLAYRQDAIYDHHRPYLPDQRAQPTLSQIIGHTAQHTVQAITAAVREIFAPSLPPPTALGQSSIAAHADHAQPPVIQLSHPPSLQPTQQPARTPAMQLLHLPPLPATQQPVQPPAMHMLHLPPLPATHTAASPASPASHAFIHSHLQQCRQPCMHSQH